MASLVYALIVRTLVLSVIGILGLFFYKLYRVRTRVRSISEKYGLPLLPHSFILGHLMISGKVAMKYPADIAQSIIPFLITEEYPEFCKNGYFYLDMWPIVTPMLVVSHPDMMAMFTQDVSFPKHEHMPWEFGPFTHGLDLVTSNGQVWKTWRSIFNPTFSLKNIQTYVPMMLQEYSIFRSKLASLAASGAIMNMDKSTMALTVDIIGHAVLGARLNAQTTGCELFDRLKEQISLLITDFSPKALKKISRPTRPFRLWRNERAMQRLVEPYILDAIRDQDSKAGGKTMLKEHSAEEGNIDKQWINIAVQQFKMMLFAGHDTVSSTFCFVTALLHNHPEELAKCRQELDAVFGTPPASPNDTDPAEALITENPEVLNRLTYLVACIKEALRLYQPVSGSVRKAAEPNMYLYHPDRPKEPVPLFDFMIFSHQTQTHRDPTYFLDPHKFVPERFLAKPGDKWYPGHKFAYRPFEHGSRNCIGQEFAMLELRLVLALALREFDFTPAISQDKIYFGMNLYQSELKTEVTMHPRDGMPMRIRRRPM